MLLYYCLLASDAIQKQNRWTFSLIPVYLRNIFQQVPFIYLSNIYSMTVITVSARIVFSCLHCRINSKWNFSAPTLSKCSFYWHNDCVNFLWNLNNVNRSPNEFQVWYWYLFVDFLRQYLKRCHYDFALHKYWS